MRRHGQRPSHFWIGLRRSGPSDGPLPPRACRLRRDVTASRRSSRSPAPPAGEADGAREGVIVAHYGVAVAVRWGDGERRRVRVRRSSGHVVGDRVRLAGSGLASLPASGVLRRRDAHGRVRAVASNLDAIGIVLAPLPVSPMGLVDRAVVAARAAGMEPFAVVNKFDLDGARELFESVCELLHPHARVFSASAVTGHGLAALGDYFARRGRGVFVGTSGVGKSSLLNALCPEVELAVGEINESSGLGRHVTSTATLHPLPGGGELVDTPGFRDFGPVEVSARELAGHFPGFEAALEEGCRFRDCLHRTEPDCAVGRAVGEGRVAPSRHEAYLLLLSELEEVERAERGY